MKRLIIATFLIILACSPDELPLSPGENLGVQDKYESTLPRLTDYFTLSYELGLSLTSTRFADIDTSQDGIQDKIILEFNEVLDNSQIQDAFELVAFSGRDTGIIPLNVEYQRDLKRCVIEPLVPLYDSTTYILKVYSDKLLDLSMNPLDGNNNGVSDGEYDNLKLVLMGPLPDADYPDLTSPEIRDVEFLSGTFPNGILTEDTVMIEFDALDIDVNTIMSGIELLRYDDLSPAGTLSLVKVDTTGPIWSRRLAAYISITGLNYEELYILRITPEITDSAGNSLDCDKNGIIELDEKYDVVFSTINSDSTPLNFPQISSITKEGNLILVLFTTEMNPYTLTSTYIQVYNENGEFVPCKIEPVETGNGFRCIILEDVPSGYIFISRNVKSVEGLPLDGNNNGVGGEIDDDVTMGWGGA